MQCSRARQRVIFFTFFKKWLDSGKVVCRESYVLPQVITPAETVDTIPHSLYDAEKDDMNQEERNLINIVVGLDNIRWWHRSMERKDFRVMTEVGKLVLIEFKGDDRDNSDSRMKLELGRQWQAQAGPNYRYFMVFRNTNLGIDRAYTIDKFVEIMRNL